MMALRWMRRLLLYALAVIGPLLLYFFSSHPT